MITSIAFTHCVAERLVFSTLDPKVTGSSLAKDRGLAKVNRAKSSSTYPYSPMKNCIPKTASERDGIKCVAVMDDFVIYSPFNSSH